MGSRAGTNAPPEVAVYSTATGKKQASLLASAPDPKLWAFSDNGQWLAFGQAKVIRRFNLRQGKEILPALAHTALLWHGVFLQENRFVTSDREGNTWFWSLDYPAVLDPDLVELGQLLTGMSLGNRSDENGTALWQSWESLRKRYPQFFEASRDEILGWHAVNGKAAYEDQQPQAVRFHCDHYRAAHPDHQPLAPFCDEMPREVKTNQFSGSILSK